MLCTGPYKTNSAGVQQLTLGGKSFSLRSPRSLSRGHRSRVAGIPSFLSPEPSFARTLPGTLAPTCVLSRLFSSRPRGRPGRDVAESSTVKATHAATVAITCTQRQLFAAHSMVEDIRQTLDNAGDFSCAHVHSRRMATHTCQARRERTALPVVRATDHM